VNDEKTGKGRLLFGVKIGGDVSGGRVLMEKIILVSREPADHKRLIALVESVFPECTVEIVEGAGGWPPCSDETPEREPVSSVERGITAGG
jgi:hypothetical protein